jgi:hypothetical protein
MLAAASVGVVGLLAGMGSNLARTAELEKVTKKLEEQSLRQRFVQLHLDAKEQELVAREAASGIDTEASAHHTPASLRSGR